MKITRDGSRVIIEAEDSDGPPGQPLEVTADALYQGALIMRNHLALGGRPDPEILRPQIDAAVQDLREKWELY